jgi:hypothetical protein
MQCTVRAAQASGTALEQLRGSAVSSRLLAMAQGPAPLPLVGQWLSEVGQCMAKATRQVRTSIIVLQNVVQTV